VRIEVEPQDRIVYGEERPTVASLSGERAAYVIT